MREAEKTQAKFSIPSIIALVAALLSFATGAFWGFVLAVVAVFFGAFGVLLSLQSRVRGGVISVLSIMIAGIAVIAAVIKAIMWLV